ncbi:MAG: pilus assembly protein PilM [Paenibacillaceae bacterium]|nr:pilus assembly protein PilM [Paenibacillaceae bacterium]
MLRLFNSTKASIGLEITDHSVKLAEIVIDKNNKIKLLSHAVEPIPPETVEDGKIKHALPLVQIVRSFTQRRLTRTKRTHLVLPSQSIMVRFLRLPDIPEKDLKRVIAFELQHNIHLPFDRPYYDFIKLNGAAGEQSQSVIKMKKRPKPTKTTQQAMAEAAAATEAGGTNVTDTMFSSFESDGNPQPEQALCDVLLVAAPLELIESYVEIAEAAGLTPFSIEFKALSLHRLVSQLDMVHEGQTFLLLDINEASSDLSIFHDQQLKITRNVPVSFTMQTKPQAPPTDADQLFAEFADTTDVLSDFRNICADLAHEVERLMNFYRYSLNNRTHEFAKLIVSGDVERLHDIVDYFKERLNVPIQVLFSYSIDMESSEPDALVARIAVPIGLGLRGNER